MPARFETAARGGSRGLCQHGQLRTPATGPNRCLRALEGWTAGFRWRRQAPCRTVPYRSGVVAADYLPGDQVAAAREPRSSQRRQPERLQALAQARPGARDALESGPDARHAFRVQSGAGTTRRADRVTRKRVAEAVKHICRPLRFGTQAKELASYVFSEYQARQGCAGSRSGSSRP